MNAVIFDFDGTLTKQCAIDFLLIRKETGCPEGVYLLDHFRTLNAEQQKEAEDLLHFHEYNAARSSEEEEGADDILTFLKKRNIPSIIISRNTRQCVVRALENFERTKPDDFYKIITRDDPFPVKPDPTSIEFIARNLNISCNEILVIGDYIHDIEAGNNAGCTTVYKVTGRDNDHLVNSDYTIAHLNELLPIFMNLFKTI